MPRHTQRDRAIIAISRLSKLVPGCYVDSDVGEPEPDMDFCFEHAGMVAQVSALETGVDTWVARMSLGADGHRYCQFRGCGLHLNCGGLTDYGIDNALGIVDAPKDPLSVHVYASELELAAGGMMHNDPRWEIWDRHAEAVLRKARRSRGRSRASTATRARA